MSRKKIMIVDDEPHIIELVKVCFEDSDYDVIEAIDGEEALQKVKESRPDIILLDIMLPRMDGYEVCRILKEDPETKSIPVVMLTAKGQEEDRTRGLECGADAYMTKPFSPLKLLTEIRDKIPAN